MLFHTWTFVLFFLIFYPVYLLVQGTRLKLPWLLLASYVFYGWWNPLYVLLIVWSTTVDYLAVIGMSRSRRRRPWLVLSVVNNLGLLGFFKYGEFLIDNLNAWAGRIGVPYAIPYPDLRFLSDSLNTLLANLDFPYRVPPLEFLLPVGISFYVFQSMSYTIDFYRGNVDREPNFTRYATFVALFPQLVAGPIERARNLLPQLREKPKIGKQDVADGLSLFVVGLFKKVALADYLAIYVDPIYATPDLYEAPALILATFAFGWQIYFDFSGYTDMARGVGRMMGIRLMLNFNNPYLATGLGDFWRRWHISLSTWFRDYVYVPLGGNRHGTFRTYRNIGLAMLISGLWHGAAWTFAAWGAVHAIGYMLTRSLELSAFYRQRTPTWVKRTWTFLFVTFAWIFFRAETFPDAWMIIRKIFGFSWVDPALPLVLLATVAAIWIYQFIYESNARRLLRPTPVRIGIVVLMVLYVALFGTSSGQAFIYFQF
jgi:D-alanyl-lipoteichoic acid acyltransferase DltB (MBOAT superfamily)